MEFDVYVAHIECARRHSCHDLCDLHRLLGRAVQGCGRQQANIIGLLAQPTVVGEPIGDRWGASQSVLRGNDEIATGATR
jgi:hypothetical protein